MTFYLGWDSKYMAGSGDTSPRVEILNRARVIYRALRLQMRSYMSDMSNNDVKD